MPDYRIVYLLWRCAGPTYSTQGGPRRGSQHKSLMCSVAQENSEEESNTENEREVAAKKDVQVMAEEKLEEINLGTNPQKPRPISISWNLSEKEKAEIILLLKEFRDVFAWDYSEMIGLDLGLVVHTLNLDPEARPVAQLARVIHTKIEEQIVKEVQKLLAASFIKPIQHPRWLSNIVPVKKKNGQIRWCVDFRNLNWACPKDKFPLPNMDLLIDSATRNVMFSFMNEFNGYN